MGNDKKDCINGDDAIGDSYHLKIELSDGTSVTVYGYNTCPAGFESLLEQAADLFLE